jgi:post-segregation antitoxin (ccd killing protein)
MVTVTASIGISPVCWEKCRRYKINRSAIARVAIEKEIERIEKEAGASLPASTPTAKPEGEAL